MARTAATRPARPFPPRPGLRRGHPKRTNPQRPQPQVPFAVWLTEPQTENHHDSTPFPDGPDIPRTVAQRVITEFSKTGDRILLAGDNSAFLSRVAECAADRAITCTTLQRTTESEPPGVESEARGSAEFALVATLQPPQRRVEIATYRRWADLLRPTGVLAVVTTNPVGPGRFHNHLGAVITAASAADLSYLQHVVAVAAHVEGDRLLVPNPEGHSPARCADGAVLHVAAHHDVIVLYRPARDQEVR
jgi:hypothetical protein